MIRFFPRFGSLAERVFPARPSRLTRQRERYDRELGYDKGNRERNTEKARRGLVERRAFSVGGGKVGSMDGPGTQNGDSLLAQRRQLLAEIADQEETLTKHREALEAMACLLLEMEEGQDRSASIEQSSKTFPAGDHLQAAANELARLRKRMLVVDSRLKQMGA